MYSDLRVKVEFGVTEVMPFFPTPRNRGFFMSENRLAVISIIVENKSKSLDINTVLSEFADYIIGRMGVPYRAKKVAIISVVIDAPSEIINKLTGKIGMLDGVTAKTLMHKA